MSENLRPEELWQGLTQNSREIFSKNEILNFLEEWSESEAFVEDLDFVVGDNRDAVKPEEVFEHLAESNNYYTVDDMLEMSETASNREWERSPEISSTGNAVELELGDKCVVPKEEEFLDVGDNFFGRTRFRTDKKDILLDQHTDYYQIIISPVSFEEFEELFSSFETLTPSQCFHEVEYGDGVYFLNSEDLSYFFEFEQELEDFNDEIYRVESSYSDFVVETYKIPDKSDYEVSVFSWGKSIEPINACKSVIGSELGSGIETKLMMEHIDENRNK